MPPVLMLPQGVRPKQVVVRLLEGDKMRATETAAPGAAG